MTAPSPAAAQRLIVAIVTSHNRRPKTIAALESFFAQTGAGFQLRGVLVDDRSTDGTAATVAGAFPAVDVLDGTGSLFWARGMAAAEQKAVICDPDYLLWLNDDVTLFPGALDRLVAVAEQSRPGPVVVAGAVQDPVTSATTYGGVVRRDWHPMRYALAEPQDAVIEVDTVHGNVLLVPRETYRLLGGIDGVFEHAYADFDYGLRLRDVGGRCLLAPGHAGACEQNMAAHPTILDTGRWQDRWRFALSPKGRPIRSQVRYLKRHGGPAWPVFAASPYLRTLLQPVRAPAAAEGGALRGESAMGLHLMVLDGTIAAYRVPTLAALRQRVGSLVVGVSQIEPDVARALGEHGVQVRVIAGIRLPRTWKHPQGFRESSPLDLPFGAYAAIRAERPDVLVSGDIGMRTLQALVYRTSHRLARCLVWTRLSEHSELGRPALQQALRPRALKGADAVIVNGESGRRYIEGLGVPSSRIRIIPQATTSPHSAVAPGPTAGGRIRLLVVCRLVELKGVQILLDVLPRCEPGRFELTIVGDGPYRTSLEERARGVDVPVTFAGHLGGEDSPTRTPRRTTWSFRRCRTSGARRERGVRRRTSRDRQ